MKAVVVGGGLAGISAAFELADAGADVTLLEARPRLGGATFSVERDGLWLDNGQHVFLRCFTEYLRLLRRLGVADQVVLQDRLDIPVISPDGRRSHLRRSGLPAPFHLGGAILRYRFLSPAERLRVLPAARALAKIDLGDPALDNRTFAGWLAEHGQSDAARAALWDLITLPAVNLPAAEASLALGAMVFKVGLLDEASAGDLGYAAVPLQRLHGDAAERVLDDAGVDVQTRSRVRSIGDVQADVVVLAVPHDEAASLVPTLEPVRGLGFSPILNVHVVYDRRVTDDPFVAGFGTPVQFVFDRSDSSGLERGQYLAVSVSGASAYTERTQDEIRDEFLPALAELFPRAREARVERFFVTREPEATFRGAPGTRALRPGPTAVEGVFLAGAWTDTGWPATMEGAVRSGLAAARAALQVTDCYKEGVAAA
ncbi:MAG TPA: hydroxysqualene dehydroxylase HpnE [Gaiellaceae bacterium]|nr:hydroxysqualene dehydroxylase HpnE [Gaiellaceae bacterium]